MPKNEQNIKWACRNCTYENWPSAIKCTLCYAPRPSNVTPKTRKPAGISEHSGKKNELITNDHLICPSYDKNAQQPTVVKWYCQGCTYENWPKSSHCVMCLAPKPKSFTNSLRNASNAETAGSNREKSRDISPKFSRTSNKHEDEISNNDKNRTISSLKNHKWICPKCTYENWPKTTDCVLCKYARPPLGYKSKNDENGKNSSLDAKKKNSATRRRSPKASVSEPTPLEIKATNQEKDTFIYDIAASANRNDSDEVRQICNSMTDSDWMWLNACVGVVENEPSAVESYLDAGGDPTTQLTREDVLVLNRPGVFELGYTLVHLAVRFHREELLTLLLTPEVAKKAFKKVPSHVSPELAAEVRKEISHTLRQRKGDWPCYFFTNQVTFALQAEIQDFRSHVQRQLFDEILDKSVQKVLEMESPVINWSEEITEQLGSRIYALWNRSAGDCLLDSILQATYGVFDSDNTLRKALFESLSEGGGRFFPRWKEWESMQAETLQYSLDEDQWEQDWASILSLASQPGTSLEQTHVFALAHILRRPIIIYGVKYVKSFRGETLGLARFEGVYLPLLWEQSFCWKNPVVLGYTRGHFSALVPMETDHVNDVGAGANVDSNEDVHVTYLPLIDHQGQLLRVHFLTGAELGSEERLLREWLDCCVTRGGILVAQQRITSRPALVNQLLDEWLDRYRKLNK